MSSLPAQTDTQAPSSAGTISTVGSRITATLPLSEDEQEEIELESFERLKVLDEIEPVKTESAKAAVSPMLVAAEPLETELEPFPVFIDIDEPFEPEPVHCILHCKYQNCRRLARSGDFGCRCNEVVQRKPSAILLFPKKNVAPKPPIEVSFLSFMPPLTHANVTGANESIQFDIAEIDDLLIAYLEYLVAETRRFDDLIEISSLEQVKDIITAFRLSILRYFESKLRLKQDEPLIVREIQLELRFYATLAFFDWVWFTYPKDIARLLCDGDWRFGLSVDTGGFPGLVADFWRDGADEFVVLMIWRRQKIAEYRRMNIQLVIWLTALLVGMIIDLLLWYWLVTNR